MNPSTYDWTQADEETYNSSLSPEEQEMLANEDEQKPRRARLGVVEAVTLKCPQCKALCVNDAGSQLIGRCDELVYCEVCRKHFCLPQSVVRMFAV